MVVVYGDDKFALCKLSSVWCPLSPLAVLYIDVPSEKLYLCETVTYVL